MFNESLQTVITDAGRRALRRARALLGIGLELVAVRVQQCTVAVDEAVSAASYRAAPALPFTASLVRAFQSTGPLTMHARKRRRPVWITEYG